jgi:hypothetical protein
MTQDEEKDLLREQFRRLTEHFNAALLVAYRAGLSVGIKTNGFLQLQEGELLQVEIGLNECEHEWDKVSSTDQTAGGKAYAWDFERCEKCNQTRSVPLDYQRDSFAVKIKPSRFKSKKKSV